MRRYVEPVTSHSTVTPSTRARRTAVAASMAVCRPLSDMIAKGRNAKGDRSGARLHPEKRLRGERNPHAKLTAEQVAEIRATPLRNGVQHALALRFGVSDAAISMIVNGKTWRPLTVSGAET